MDNITNYKELKKSIDALENRQLQEVTIIKNEFSNGLESLKPGNLIKSTLLSVTKTAGMKESLIATTIGLVAGYVSKKVFIGTSHNPIKKLAGTLVLIAMTNIVTRHPERIKSAGRTVIKLFGKLIGAKPRPLGDDFISY
ncbi:MAG: hypothetical protein IPM42_14605 [Saprospiraceae bacterium]|nr:hypothetical protein [Saprospiraceae bacterium]